MALQASGIAKSTDELRYRTHTYKGTWGSSTGTALQHMARVAQDLGVSTRGLYDGRGFRIWSMTAVQEEVRLGYPAMILASAYYDRAILYPSQGETRPAIEDLERAADLYASQGDVTNQQRGLDALQQLQGSGDPSIGNGDSSASGGVLEPT